MLGSVWKAEDPRDNLEKAGKYEIWQFAKANGVLEITYETPSILARKILRAKGLVNIRVADRPIGSDLPTVYNSDAPAISSVTIKSSETREINADDLLMAEYQQQKSPRSMTMTELRTACKSRGIKMARTDNLRTLREKLEQNAS